MEFPFSERLQQLQLQKLQYAECQVVSAKICIAVLIAGLQIYLIGNPVIAYAEPSGRQVCRSAATVHDERLIPHALRIFSCQNQFVNAVKEHRHPFIQHTFHPVIRKEFPKQLLETRFLPDRRQELYTGKTALKLLLRRTDQIA